VLTQGVRILTAMIKWHLRPPASKLSSSRLPKQGQVVSMQDTFTAEKT